jgi:hypothetical protein
MVASPTATHCRLLTGSRSTRTASAPPKTEPLSRTGATRPNERERQRTAGRDCPHHSALRRQNFRPKNAGRTGSARRAPSLQRTHRPDSFMAQLRPWRLRTPVPKSVRAQACSMACAKATLRMLADATRRHVAAPAGPRQVEECYIDWRPLTHYRAANRERARGRSLALRRARATTNPLAATAAGIGSRCTPTPQRHEIRN